MNGVDMLHRLGNKQQIVNRILPYFPEHEIYIEPFFGAGGVFLNKTKVKFNFINDNNEDVFNLFMVLKNNNDEFLESFHDLPIDQNLFNYWKKHEEKDPIQKALRFVMLSNYSHLGLSNTFTLLIRNIKNVTLSKIPKVNELLNDVRISNLDFERFLKSIPFEDDNMKNKSFIYADPPYLNKTNNYGLKWTIEDTVRLFYVLTDLNIKFAMSETESDFIDFLAGHFKLNIIDLGEVRRLSTTRKELLIINY